MEGVAPKGLIAKRVEAERLPPRSEHLGGIVESAGVLAKQARLTKCQSGRRHDRNYRGEHPKAKLRAIIHSWLPSSHSFLRWLGTGLRPTAAWAWSMVAIRLRPVW